MYTIPSNALRVLNSRLLQAVSSASSRQVLLVGPEGRGKTNMLKNLMRHGTVNHAFSYYDFEVNSHHNFQVMIVQWASSLISQNPLIQLSQASHAMEAFDQLKKDMSDVEKHARSYFGRILSHKTLEKRVSSHLERILEADKDIDGRLWSETSQLLLVNAPWTMGLKDSHNVGEIEAICHSLVASTIIAEKVELENQGEIHPSSKLTGKLTTSCLLRYFKILSDKLGKNWVLCLDGINHLCSSPFLRDRGEVFLDHTIDELQGIKINSVLASDSSVPCVKLLDPDLSNSLKQMYKLPPEKPSGEAAADKSGLMFLDVPELETSVTASLLRNNIFNCNNITKALLRVVGGNIGLLSNIITSYTKMEETLDLPAVQQILAGSKNPVDDEYFPFKESVEDQVRYLQEERCKMFVRNLHNVAIRSEISRFENLMNQFLSLPGIEEMKLRLKNRVHFWVTVSETIRYMLRKPAMQLKPGMPIENKILLALIATGFVHLNLDFRSLEFKDSLTKLLLESYINNEYETLTWIQQVEYKANYLLNQKTIYHELDRLLL